MKGKCLAQLVRRSGPLLWSERYDYQAQEKGNCLGLQQADFITMHAQLGFPDKSCAIKGLVVFYVLGG